LLSKDDWRLSLRDEPFEFRPKMSRVVESFSFAGNRKRLAGAAAGPDRAIVFPSSEACGKAPSPDTGEKMTLGISFEVVWLDIGD
jgi:hypothetical protein